MMDDLIQEDVRGILGHVDRGFFEGRRVLVTGGAGFLGSWLCDVLVGLDAYVTCLDSLSSGDSRNISHLLGRGDFKFLKGDVCTIQLEERYDYIMHLASPASPEEYLLHPIETLRANSMGSFNMLELALKNDARILFSSTSEVYGDADIFPTPESYSGRVNPVGPRSCYYEGKRFAEALFMAYHRKHGLDVRIARIFNSYGPRLRADGAYARSISRFISQALTGQPITVYGDGTQTRSFCYVSDTILGILSLFSGDGVRGEVFNIGNPEEVTILELAQMVKGLTGSASPITFHPLPRDDPRRRCPDIGRAVEILGWRPRVSLREGLERTIRWFESHLQV